MSDLVITLGVDIGNSAIKVRPDEGEAFSLPTMVDPVASMGNFAESKDPMRQLDLNIMESKSATLGRAFYGHLASETGNGRAMPVRAIKARTPEVYMGAVLAMAAAACRRIESMKKAGKALVERAKAEGRPLEVTVHLGTGLPLGEFTSDELKKEFRKGLRGTHRVQFVTTPAWREYGEIRLTVETIEICSEGMAVLYDLCFDPSGNLVDERLAEGRVLVNDVGAGTHDMPYYEEMDLRNALTRPYDSRVNENMEQIKEAVNTAFIRDLTRYDVERFIFDKRSPHCIPNGNLEPISIRHITEPRFRSLAVLYAQRTKEAFEGSKGAMSHVVMAGGGSALVREFMEEELVRLGLPSPLPFRIMWLSNAQMANASGYYKLINVKALEKAAKMAQAGD